LINAIVDGLEGSFIFDTGADGVIIHSKHNQKSTHLLQTLAGEVTATKSSISLLELGNYHFKNLVTSKSDLTQLSQHVSGRLLGIIGARLFSSEILYIDNIRKVIELAPRDFTPRADTRYFKSKMKLVNDIWLIPIRLGQSTYDFILDTGSTASFISEEVINLQNKLFSKLENRIDIITASKSIISSEIYTTSEAFLGPISVQELQFASSDFSDFHDLIPLNFGGILSLDQLPFSSIIIDFQSKNILFGI